jgi:hypothetical protein
VSRALQHGDTDDPPKGIRLPAAELEGHVVETIARILDDRTVLATMLKATDADMQSLALSCAGLASELRERAHRLSELVCQVRVLRDRLEVDASAAGLAAALQIAVTEYPRCVPLAAAVRLKRHGHVIRLVQPDGRSPGLARPHVSLINLLAKGRCHRRADWQSRAE